MYSSLILGIIFGFLLKRGRFCPTGTIRDIYLEKKPYNIVLILAIIFTQAFFYFLMTETEIIYTSWVGFFKPISVGIGSFIFGLGAIMASGCITSSIVKAGDGRIVGISSIAFYLWGYYEANSGHLKMVDEFMNRDIVLDGDIISGETPIPLIISAIMVILLYTIMYKHYKKNKPKFKIPAQYSGLRHIFFEKIWSKEVTAIAIGILMALGVLSSNLSGRCGGFSIGPALLTWLGLGVKVDLSETG